MVVINRELFNIYYKACWFSVDEDILSLEVSDNFGDSILFVPFGLDLQNYKIENKIIHRKIMYA